MSPAEQSVEGKRMFASGENTVDCLMLYVFFFKQKTAYEMLRSLVGSEMCIRDRLTSALTAQSIAPKRGGVVTVDGVSFTVARRPDLQPSGITEIIVAPTA